MTVRKNINLLLLTILLAWFGGVGSVWADSTVSTWDGTTLIAPTEQDADNYYQIWTAAQWAHVSANPATYQNKSFRFYSDIDMGNYEMNQILGGNDQRYNGSIDGQNHTIKGLNIRRNSYDTGGVVGWLGGGTIRDLNVQGSVYSSGMYGCGGICTYGSGSVINCTFTGTVEYTNSDGCGGIVGSVVGGMTIENCTSDATVIAPTYAGALVGKISTSSSVDLSGSRYTGESVVVIKTANSTNEYLGSDYPDGIGIGQDGAPINSHGVVVATVYSINTNAASVTNGSFTVKNLKGEAITSAIEGIAVYITAVPNTGYSPFITVKDADNAEIALTETGVANQYSFPMPAKNVTISVSFEIVIANVSISDISAPVTLSAFDNEASCTTTGVASISSVTWKNGSTTVLGSAIAGIAYTAEVTLTPSSEYRFTSSTAVTVNGNPATSATKSGDNLIATYTFPATVKLNPTVTTAPTASTITYGQTLANSTLAGGVASIPGTFTWTNNTIVPSVSDSQNTAYGVTFNPADDTNYNTATTTVQLTILPKPITSSDITVTVTEATYTGQRQTPVITVQDGTTVLTNNTDYTISYKGSRLLDAQTYVDEIIITGIGNYTGTREEDFTIVPKALDGTNTDDFTISAVPTQIYDGTNAVNPSVSVFDKGNMLTKDMHYTIAYGGNNTEGVNAGTITITGIDQYSGSKIFHFDIVNEHFTEGNITYHATSGTTVAVGNQTHTAATTLTGAVEIPATVTHVVAAPFQVTGIEKGAFKNKTDVTGISMPHETLYLEYIEDKAFEGCTNLRYIDLCHATGFTPTSLQRHIAASPFYGVPKQALVYLNGTTFIGENYVYKPGNGSNYYCELFKVYDDISGSQTAFSETNGYQWEFENRHDFTASTIVNTRKLKAGQHYTTCLPYDLPIPADMKAYTLAGTNTANTLIGFAEVTGTLMRFKPYVIIPSTSGQLLGTTNAEIAAFTETDDAAKGLGPVTTGGFTMGGTMRYIDGPDAEGFYIMQGKNASGVCTWKKVESAASNTGANPVNPCVLPMRAYIKNTTSGAPPRLHATFTDLTGAITTVNQLRLDENDADEEIYDLLGRRVKTPRKGAIYIINHRKVQK